MLTTDGRSLFVVAILGPASPLVRNPQSQKGWKEREPDGVGLSILAKLDGAGSGATGHRACNAIKPSANAGYFPVADFLKCCYLCRKSLQGRDIYMYKGDQAFCSMECRHEQIIKDDCMDKYGSELTQRLDVSSSPFSGKGGGRFFFTEIVAA